MIISKKMKKFSVLFSGVLTFILQVVDCPAKDSEATNTSSEGISYFDLTLSDSNQESSPTLPEEIEKAVARLNSDYMEWKSDNSTATYLDYKDYLFNTFKLFYFVAK